MGKTIVFTLLLLLICFFSFFFFYFENLYLVNLGKKVQGLSGVFPSRGRNHPTLERVSKALYSDLTLCPFTSLCLLCPLSSSPSPTKPPLGQTGPINLKITKAYQSGQRANHRAGNGQCPEQRATGKWVRLLFPYCFLHV